MSDKIQGKIKKEFQEADGKLKKAGVVAAVAALAPAVGLGIAAEKVAEAANNVAGKIKEENANAQLRKHNPLFLDEFQSEDFQCPEMLTIVDDAEGKEEGTLGWRSIEDEMEVLHLYDASIEESGFTFIPTALCHSVYYADPHNRQFYINVENLYEKMQQQKLAELADVAFCLGAKSYTIEILEEESKKVNKKRKAGIDADAAKVKVGAGAEHMKDVDEKAKRLAYQAGEFTKSRTPIVPVLCWFKEDPIINGLIKQVCETGGAMKSNELILEGSKYAVMSQSTAAKIEGAMKKIGVKATVDLDLEAKQEFSSKIHFHLEF